LANIIKGYNYFAALGQPFSSFWPSDVQGGGEAADQAGVACEGPSKLASPGT